MRRDPRSAGRRARSRRSPLRRSRSRPRAQHPTCRDACPPVRFPCTVASEDLLGLYWTTSGPVEVHVGREWSLFDLRDRCEHAARVGFQGLGLWHADLEHVLETRTLPEVKTLFDDNGLEHLELEFLWEWFLDPGDERRRDADRTRRLLFDAAAALGAHHVKAGNIPGTPCELP